MKKFLYNSCVMILAVVVGYVVISFVADRAPKKSNDYMAAIIDKHNRIHEINRSKIILAGGSNLAFGINSQKLQDEFSVPVVNLGLHAGLGLEFIVRELEASIHEGDVVFLSIEYFLGNDGLYDLQNYTQSLFPEASNYYTRNSIKDLQIHIEKTRSNLEKLNQQEVVDTSFSVYSRKGFNQFGDMIAHLDQLPPAVLNDRSIMKYQYWKGIDVLNEFYTYAQSKNVKVFFIYPNHPISEYKKNQLAITELKNDISKNLLIEVLNTPQDFVFEDALFYDTVYHLNKDGRELRTNKLIEIIKKHPNAQNAIAAMAKI